MQQKQLLLILFLIFVLSACSMPSASPTPLPPTITDAPTYTPAVTETPAPTPTPEATFTPEASPTPEIAAGTTRAAAGDGMLQVYIPAVSFSMGSDADRADEQPVHTVHLSAYWIDQTEVTNAMYALCVGAGVCEPPYHHESMTQDDYYGNDAYANYPVVWINWEKANAYCQWAGRRLPTEAEWEYAARGDDGRTYPWGEDVPNCSLANHKTCLLDTAEVGSFPQGASPFGVLDMAGNASEWVADWFGPYPADEVTDPQGPDSGEYRILRGGSFVLIDSILPSYHRLAGFTIPGYSYYDSGFRCAESAAP